jgi:hypothetical protein
MRFWKEQALGGALGSFVSVAALLLSACAGVKEPRPNSLPAGRIATVYVVHHGALHTGLTLKRSDIPRGHWPASAYYGNSKHIEIR